MRYKINHKMNHLHTFNNIKTLLFYSPNLQVIIWMYKCCRGLKGRATRCVTDSTQRGWRSFTLSKRPQVYTTRSVQAQEHLMKYEWRFCFLPPSRLQRRHREWSLRRLTSLLRSQLVGKLPSLGFHMIPRIFMFWLVLQSYYFVLS